MEYPVMKYPVLIFYLITTGLLTLIIVFQDSSLLPYLEVLYIVFTFAESYFVLQNYDFDHGIPFVTTFIKLANTITIPVFPAFAMIVHIIVDLYIYTHIRGLDRRHKRLKYDYTVNNVIPGPILLKIFASFLSPLLFLIITILCNLRIVQNLKTVKRIDLVKYIFLADLAVFGILLTSRSIVGFLVYMIMLVLFEFIPIENRL